VQHRPGDSHFWAGLRKAKEDFLAYGTFKVQSGEKIRFWEDIWLGNQPSRKVYPNLYKIVRRKDNMVANMLRAIPLNVSFRRGLVNENQISWFDSVCQNFFQFTSQTGKMFSSGTAARMAGSRFGSMYGTIIRQGVILVKSPIWEWIQLKIKIFLWYLFKGVTFTKDNLAKRNWQGSVKCYLCSSVETIQYLLFDCHFARYVWNIMHITFGIQPPTSIANSLVFGYWD
jgi:hypothetical protein